MKTIQSISNPLIQQLFLLKDKSERLKKKQFLIEGYHLVEEASKLNLLEMVLSTNKDSLENINTNEKYLVTDNIIKKLSTTKTPQDIIGVVSIKDLCSFEELLNKDNLKLVILDDVSDPGNLGTIIRTSCALGYDAIISSPQTVDYYNEKVIRSTQGAIFKLPLFKMDLIELIEKLKIHHIYIFGTSLKSSKSIKNLNHYDKYAIIFGNEAHGISDKVLSATDLNVIIPMESDVESLNVGVASAIIMWELKK